MLADTESPNRPQLKGGRHRDAALLVESNKKGTRAIVVFESGRADLIVLDDLKSPAQHEVATANVTFAAFSESATSGCFLTATKDGKVDLWDFEDGKPKKRASLSHGTMPVGIAGFSTDEQRVVSLSNDGTFRLWDAITGRLIASKP
jgi:WD40 repeat protein